MPLNSDVSKALSGVSIIGVVGGPGSGKGTQCELLAKSFGATHISIGEMMRREAEEDPDSELSKKIKDCHSSGSLGDVEMTGRVLIKTLTREANRGARMFILDGFPRALDRVTYFEDNIAPITHLVALECSDDEMIRRLTGRGADRADDRSQQAIRARINTFRRQTQPVIGYFRTRGTCICVDAEQGVDAVQRNLSKELKEALGTETK